MSTERRVELRTGRRWPPDRSSAFVSLIVSLVAVLSLLGCADFTEPGAGATPTTLNPPGNPGKPSDYNSPTRIATFEGLSIAVARRLANEAGWTEVTVREIGEPVGPELADYHSLSMTLLEVDGTVVEAWTG